MNTIAAVRDPVTAMTAQFGERVIDAKATLARLEGTLRHIDDLRASLREAGVTVDVDLGAIGNAAAAARRAEAAGQVRPGFVLPKAS